MERPNRFRIVYKPGQALSDRKHGFKCHPGADDHMEERENGAAGEGISAKPIHENKEKSKFKKL